MEAGYRRRVVKVEMAFLDALPMVALWIGEPKQSFFQEIILLVPEAESNVYETVRVRDPCDTVLSPTEGPGSGVFVREV